MQARKWGRRFGGPVAMTHGAVVAVAGSFGDWLRSGTVGRSSYDILGLVDRLGFAPDGSLSLLVRAWPVMPLLLTIGVVATWWERRILGAAFGIVGGLYAGGLGAAVAFAIPDRHSISVGASPTVTAIGAAIVIVGALASVFVRVPDKGVAFAPAPAAGHGEVSRPTGPGVPAPRGAPPVGRS